jgi:type IV secretory pathway ATPase VirB11/archaellum biosynthesis ATPase
MRGLRARLSGGESGEHSGCGCDPAFDGNRLVVDAETCDEGGRLAASERCRGAVIDALTGRDAGAVLVRVAGLERAYDGRGAALLVAAGRFVERVAVHDDRLATRARTDPLAAAREAAGRAGPVADIAAETGLAEVALDVDGYERILHPFEGPAISRWRVLECPPDGRLVDVRDLDTGGTARLYRRDDGPDRYHLRPLSRDLSADETATLAAAAGRLADRLLPEGERAAARAVGAVADEGAPVEVLTAVLQKHTHGYGLLADVFADPSVSDAFVTAPTDANRVRVTVDGTRMETNVRLVERGAAALASRLRRTSGRAFSRADPTIDATVEIAGRRVRVAGLRRPVSDGRGFALRAHDRVAWTLPELVDNGTLTARAAAVLSLAVERGGAIIVAGARGAGKTTTLAALLREIPPAVRTVVIEDTPELPVGALRDSGRDVQALRVGDGETEVSAVSGLRTALRLGDGALVVGEVRGEEAGVLYEAMRVGAHSEAVLGTIHGESARGVFERVVSDLGVPASSFGATDLVVTLEHAPEGRRRVVSVDEVLSGEPPEFGRLYDYEGVGLVESDRVDRGNSQLLADLTDPAESYSDVLSLVGERAETIVDRAAASSNWCRE